MLAYNIVTRETTIYDNANKAGRFLNLNGDTTAHRATVEYRWPMMDYLFRWADSKDPAPFRDFTETELKALGGKIVRFPTQVVFPDGTVELFAGTKEMSARFGLKKMEFQYYINNKKQHKGISFEYLK